MVFWMVSSGLLLLICSANRYIFDNDLQVSIFSQEKGVETNGFQGSHLAIVELSWLPVIVRDFILPAGFPGTHTLTALFDTLSHIHKHTHIDIQLQEVSLIVSLFEHFCLWVYVTWNTRNNPI